MHSLPGEPSHHQTRAALGVGRLLLILSAGAIAAITLVPTSSARSAALTPLYCLVCGDYGAVDVVLNTALFIPFGLSLGLLRIRWQRAALVALIVSLAIELLQLTLIYGRDASLSDVLTNTAGGALGCWISLHWRRLLLPSPRFARSMFAALLLGWAFARLSTAWLLRPSFPDTRWYGQIAPRDVYPFNFVGTVVSGAIGGVPARSDEMPELNAAFRTPEVGVRAMVRSAGPTEGLASILSVLDDQQVEVVLLGQERDAARLRFRLRSADLKFRTPSVRLTGVFPREATDAFELVGDLSPGRLALSRVSTSGVPDAVLPLDPGLGWALVLPFNISLTPRAAMVGTAVTTAVTLLLIGFFAGRAWHRRPHRAVGASLAASTLAIGLPLLLFPEASLAATEAAVAVVVAVVSARLSAIYGVRERVAGESARADDRSRGVSRHVPYPR